MSDKETRTKRFTMLPPKRIFEMISEVRAFGGYESDSAVIFVAIRELHAKTFPAYLSKKLKGSGGGDEPANEVGIGSQLCNALGGRIIEGENGKKVCVFHNFRKRKAMRQELPLNQLTDSIVRNQYSPNREAVEKLREAGDVEYDIKELN